MERQPVAKEFWFLRTHRGIKAVGYLDPHSRETTYFTARVIGGWVPNLEGMDNSVKARGSGVPVEDIERPATKEEIQAWIDKWGMPETFKGQPEYPLEETKQEVKPTQEPVKLYEPNKLEIEAGAAVSTDRFAETGEFRLPIKGEWYCGTQDNQQTAYKASFNFCNVKCKILKPYTSTIHPFVEALTEGLLAKEFAEAKKKVKEAKERATAIREIIRLEEVIKKSTQLKAELTKKWIGGDK